MHSSPRSQLCRLVYAAKGQGHRLDVGLRRTLEHSLGTDLSALNIHIGPQATQLTSMLECAAFTVATDIFIAADCYRPATRSGLWLLAHEAAHAVQQAQWPHQPGSGLRLGDAASGYELAAELAAGAVIEGNAGADHRLLIPQPRTDGPLFVQRFSSWEHYLLGNSPTATLVALASHSAGWQGLVQPWRSLLALWMTAPGYVTEEQVHAIFPDLVTLRLSASGCLTTLGELNSMSDYVSSAEALNALPRDVILPLLQQIRQRGYNRLGGLLGDHTLYHFADAVSHDPGDHELGALEEMDALERFTAPLGINHYKGMLARNACHFVPFSWYRWQTNHLTARSLASAAHQERDPTTQADLIQRAWVTECYADHFLEDSFAAGHQVNKTLVMQWFLDWVARSGFISVLHRAGAERMTLANQPHLWGRPLYERSYSGLANDPQTVQEQASYERRRGASGVVAYSTSGVDEAYQQYLNFLASALIQLSSNQVHNYLNSRSLWVASANSAVPLQIWGDKTLLTGVEHVRQVSELVHAAQQVIRDLITSGQSAITSQMLLDCLPSLVFSDPSNPASAVPLADWHEHGLQAFCNDIFDRAANWLADALSQFSPHMGQVSLDQLDAAPYLVAPEGGKPAAG